MHPAKSVIYFTTATGAGYGLFFWLALFALQGYLPADRMTGVVMLAVAFGLVISGLLSSTGHLGHPERAWRAFSQWRSSWLSREGVMAILTFIPMTIFGIYWVFLGQNTGMPALVGIIGGVMALITVFTTSMIYASLKTIPAWHNVWTKIGYLAICLMSGAVLVMTLAQMLGNHDAANHLFLPSVILLVTGLLIKVLYWLHIHSDKTVSTAETATGLGRFGKVSLAAQPHSAANYLLKEMGFQIARKHADKIRMLSVWLGFAMPIVLTVWAWHGLTDVMRTLALVAAAVSCFIGLIFERWLFFAEAKHTVTLYYGQDSV